MRTVLGLCLGLAVLAGGPAACVVVMEDGAWESYQPAEFKKTTTLTAPHVANTPLDVETGNGAIEVASENRVDVSIVAKIRAVSQERLDGVVISAARQPDGLLKVRVDWPEGKAKNNEGVSFEIKTPGAQGVTLKTGNGAIKIAGLTGAAKLNTSNGAIEADHRGDVLADTSNGKVIIVNAASAKASSSNGAIDIRLADNATGPLSADTSNGSITVQVPSTLNITLDARTSNGSITAPNATGTKTRKTIVLGTGEGKGELKTSNGSITVK